jgi:hypothetical protein
MNKKTSILFRFGTCLVTVSLALLLVVAMPSNSPYPLLLHSDSLPSHSYKIIYNYCYLLTPQQELNLNFTSNQEVTCYILDIDSWDLINALEIRGNSVTWNNANNISRYLEMHPSIIQFKTNSIEENIKYIPHRTLNSTVVVVNLSDDIANIQLSGIVNNTYAPQSRLLEMGFTTCIAGIIFLTPGIMTFYKKGKTKRLIQAQN